MTDERRAAIEDQNRPQLRPRTDHVESWFLRANDPHGPRALWLKATMLGRKDGTGFAQAWACVFDEDRTQGVCETVAFEEASFATTPGGATELTAAGLTMRIDHNGGMSSGLLNDQASSTPVNWQLAFDPIDGPLMEPLTVLPGPLRNAPFVKNKLFTPFPATRVSGTLTWAGGTLDLANWTGMQGHNWGAAHSPEYAWGHCLFRDEHTGEVTAVVEATSGRLVLGPVTSPLLSAMVVRHGDDEYRFDWVVDLWRQHPTVDFPRWSLTMGGPDGRATLEATVDPRRMVCLTYQNPRRAASYCLNSKTATMRLKVTPKKGRPFELISECGGALEFLLPETQAGLTPVG